MTTIKNKSTRIILISLALVICGVIVYNFFPSIFKVISNEVEYISTINNPEINNELNEQEPKEEVKEEPVVIPISHIKTPEVVKAILPHSNRHLGTDSFSALQYQISPEPSGTAVRTVSSRGLNTSLPRCVHPDSIKLVFYERP